MGKAKYLDWFQWLPDHFKTFYLVRSKYLIKDEVIGQNDEYELVH